MFEHGILTVGYTSCIQAFVKHKDNVLHIFHFVFLLWHATTPRKQWCLPGPSIRVEAQLDQSQMWLLRCWLCLSCLQMQLRTDSSFSGPIFSPRIYIHGLLFWHKLQTRNIWFCHIKGSVCSKTSLRATVYVASAAAVSDRSIQMTLFSIMSSLPRRLWWLDHCRHNQDGLPDTAAKTVIFTIFYMSAFWPLCVYYFKVLALSIGSVWPDPPIYI